MKKDLNIYHNIVIYEKEITMAIRCHKILNGIDTRTQVLVENVDFNFLIRDGLKKMGAILIVSKNDPEIKLLKTIIKSTKNRYKRNGNSAAHRIHRIGFYPSLIDKNTAIAEQYFDCSFETFMISCFIWNMQKVESRYQKKLKQEKIASREKAREKAKEISEVIESQNLPKIRKGKQQIEEEKRLLVGEIDELKNEKAKLESEILKAKEELKILRKNINTSQFENWEKTKKLSSMSDILLHLCFEVDAAKEASKAEAKDFEVGMYKRIIAAKKMRNLDYTSQEAHLKELLA